MKTDNVSAHRQTESEDPVLTGAGPCDAQNEHLTPPVTHG